MYFTSNNMASFMYQCHARTHQSISVYQRVKNKKIAVHVSDILDTNKNMEGDIRTKECRHKRVQDILKPLLLSMKLFGVYHDVHNVNNVHPSATMMCISHTKPKMFNFVILSRFYSVAVLILVWANLIRFSVTVPPNDQGITGRIVIFVWFGLVAVGDLVMFIACESPSHLNTFYKHWNDIYQNTQLVNVECRGAGLSRVVLIGTVAGWILVVLNMFAFICLDFIADTGFAATMMKPFSESTLTSVILLFLQLLLIGVYIFPIILLIVICYVVKSSFHKVSSVVEEHINKSEESVPLGLDKLRRIHLQLCRVVSILDRSVRLLVVLEYITNIPLACFIVYQLVNINTSLIMVVVNIFWMLWSIITIVAITLSCALVHDAAHSPLDHIFEIHHSHVTPEESLEVTLFLGQLTGKSVGFTVMGMMVLTKEVLLTLAGLYITYFFLLLQFRI